MWGDAVLGYMLAALQSVRQRQNENGPAVMMTSQRSSSKHNARTASQSVDDMIDDKEGFVTTQMASTLSGIRHGHVQNRNGFTRLESRTAGHVSAATQTSMAAIARLQPKCCDITGSWSTDACCRRCAVHSESPAVAT